MTCYSPMTGYRSRQLTATGKRPIVFNRDSGYTDMPVSLPCGQCIGCRLDKSREWAVRCVHEAQLHQENCFITLTYNEQNLPSDGSLQKTHLQKFWKRLRKHLNGKQIRYYACGEYGGKTKRPHYHACLFGHDFEDKELYSVRESVPLYKSETLSKIWGKGFVTIGSVTFESAAYVARYITKKIYGEAAADHYTRVCEITGEITNIEPEYTVMSRRPGIGKEWFTQYKNDVFPKDYFHINGFKMKPPKYYENLYELENPESMEIIKGLRRKRGKMNAANSTPDRLESREKVKKAQHKMLKRSLEDQY